MAGGRNVGSIGDLGTLFRDGCAAGSSDQALIDRFTGRDGAAAELAFAALVRRHGPMVEAVCRRRLPDPADAEDAFQATFVILARKAGSVRLEGRGSLGPWLHGVGVRVSRRARALAERRRGRERTDIEPPDRADPSAGGEPDVELRSVLDEELARLPGPYRDALVLCYLEGLTHEEAAARLACPVGTVRSRLSRGRDLLRSRLTRRGYAPAVALIGPAAFRPLAESRIVSTARVASRLATGRAPAGVVPAGVATLVAGVSRTMTWTKIGQASAIAVAALLGILGLVASAQDGARKAARPKTKAQAAAPAAAAAAEDPEFADFPAFVVRTDPPAGAADVDPSLSEIRITFSRPMQDGSWSWSQLSPETFPKTAGKPHYEKDKRTCVLPVKLEPGKSYAIFANSPRFANFRDADGDPSVPYLLVFRTRK